MPQDFSLHPLALADMERVLGETLATFGPHQFVRYEALIQHALAHIMMAQCKFSASSTIECCLPRTFPRILRSRVRQACSLPASASVSRLSRLALRIVTRGVIIPRDPELSRPSSCWMPPRVYRISESLPPIAWRSWLPIAVGSTAFASTTSGGFAFAGSPMTHTTWRSSTTTRRYQCPERS
jgi:hypothetical protein